MGGVVSDAIISLSASTIMEFRTIGITQGLWWYARSSSPALGCPII